LISLIGIDRLNIFQYLVVIWIQEKPASTFGHQLVQSPPTFGSPSGIPLISENVNCRPRTLAHVDDIVDSSMAGVVDSVREQQDEVPSHSTSIRIPSITTGLIE
jgi:hypothetical protein